MSKERIVDLAIRKQLAFDLRKKLNRITNTIEKSENANTERQRLLEEISERKSNGDRDVFMFEQKWLAVDSLIEKENSEMMLAEAKAATKAFQEAKGLDPSHQKMRAVETIMRKAGWAIARDMACMRVVLRKLNTHTHMFNNLQRSTKVDDIDDLVERFMTAEKRNFEKFNEVNALSDEIDAIE